jgi:hypothetical protein
MPAISGVRSYKSSSRIRAVILAAILLGNVNFLFLIHMAQEQQQRAGAENHGAPERNPTVYVPASGVGVRYELVEFKNTTTQSGQTYN